MGGGGYNPMNEVLNNFVFIFMFCCEDVKFSCKEECNESLLRLTFLPLKTGQYGCKNVQNFLLIPDLNEYLGKSAQEKMKFENGFSWDW
jgi:hypothetical protein